MAEFEEKTEQPTGRRREKAREEGQVARSRELASMASTAGMLIVFALTGRQIFSDISGMIRYSLRIDRDMDVLSSFRLFSMWGMELLLPFFGMAVFMAIFSNAVQGGIVFKPLKVDMNRFNPAEGLKRLFSVHAFMEFIKGLAKFGVGGLLVYMILKKMTGLAVLMQDMDIEGIGRTTYYIIFYAVKVIFGTFFVIAVLDYINEKWKFERSLRMTKQEVKDEQKQTEGNPMVKARIRSLQREAARRRMMQEVPRATVVITNPTHYAVALKYVDGVMPAPRVVAKGAGFVAQKIRETAVRHYVPVVEDRPLARALFRVELNSEIPGELYRAVAKILAYVFRLKGVMQ